MGALDAQPRITQGDVDPGKGVLQVSSSPSLSFPALERGKLANGAFGGTFTPRLDMNLREGKRRACDAQSFLMDARRQRPVLFHAAVQADKTATPASEAPREARAAVGDKPLTAVETAKIKGQRIRGLPGSCEITAAVPGAMEGIVAYHRTDDHVQTLKPRSKEIVQPRAMAWVIVGELKRIEASARR